MTLMMMMIPINCSSCCCPSLTALTTITVIDNSPVKKLSSRVAHGHITRSSRRFSGLLLMITRSSRRVLGGLVRPCPLWHPERKRTPPRSEGTDAGCPRTSGIPLREHVPFVECFPYVCLEPVVVKGSSLVHKVAPKRRSLT